MTVKEAVELLSYGEHFILIGARTGKKLYNSRINRKERLKKFEDMHTTDSPFYAFFDPWTETISKQINCIKPMIAIWVSGE